MTEPGMERFEDFVTLRLSALYRFGLTLTGNPHDAEDLVQEALVRTGLAWRRVRRQDAPESYVRMTMTRLMVNRWRRKWRENPVAEVPDRAAVDPALDRIADRSYLDCAVRDLPPACARSWCCATWRDWPTRRSPPRSAAPSAR